MEPIRTVTMIPARRRVGNTAREEERPKLRVAAYCRVEFTAASMHFPVLFVAPNAEIFIAELHGTTGANTPLFGDAAPGLSLDPTTAMHQPSARQNSKMRRSRQSIRLLAAEKI